MSEGRPEHARMASWLRVRLGDPAYRFAIPVVLAGSVLIAWMVKTGAFAGVAGMSGGAIALGLVIVVSEFVPLKLPRQSNDTAFSASTLFVVAMLVLHGPGPAVAWFAGAAVIHDVARRQPAIKVAFNAAQYALSLSAAGWVLDALSDLPAAAGDAPLTAFDLPAIALSAMTLFVVNHLLSATVSSLASGASLRTRLTRDDGALLLLEALMLGFVPVVIVIVDFGSWLLPLLGLPFGALLLSAREADRRQQEALRDALTGLPNRAMFRRRIAEELERGRHVGGDLAVLLLDLDRFKEINDALGHDQGDAVLCEVARRLPTLVRDGDLVARLGGDEFAVLITAPPSLDEVLGLAARIRARLDEPVVIGGLRVAAGASIGVSWADGPDAETLVRRADVAMYAAKQRRCGVAVYDAAGDPHSPARLQLLAELREAIPNRQLVVHYQPKLTLKTNRVEGVEALVRWQHPERGLLAPGAFIELAERSDLMDALTVSVLRDALAQVRAWAADGLELTVAVNVSAQSLIDRSLPETVAEALAEFGVPAARLQLEITESSLMRDTARSAAVLHAMTALGVRISIDDFGTGYSSLAALQRLPVDEIKIDRSFVGDMVRTPSDAAIVRSTIDLADNLGLSVVAEGVETTAALEELRAFGCHEAQGYLISRPVPADELTAWLLAREQLAQA